MSPSLNNYFYNRLLKLQQDLINNKKLNCYILVKQLGKIGFTKFLSLTEEYIEIQLDITTHIIPLNKIIDVQITPFQ